MTTGQQKALQTDITRQRAIIYVVRGRPGNNDRPPLPSGHPVTWGAIVDQTVLDGALYPHPVFRE